MSRRNGFTTPRNKAKINILAKLSIDQLNQIELIDKQIEKLEIAKNKFQEQHSILQTAIALMKDHLE